MLFLFLTSLFGSSLFSSSWVWLVACWFYLFKKTSSWFYWCFIYFLKSLVYLFPLWFFLFPYLCWLWILFVLLFLPLLGNRLGYLIFFCFLRKACISQTSLLDLLLVNLIDFIKFYFHCHLPWSIFWFLWFYHWLIGFLEACCIVSMFLFFSDFYFYDWCPASYYCV